MRRIVMKWVDFKRSFKKKSVVLSILGLLSGVSILGLHHSAGAAACALPNSDYGMDTMVIPAPAAATYTIWTRMKVPDTNNNSIGLQVDDTFCFNIGGDATMHPNTWQWVQYTDGNLASIASLPLIAANHTFKLIGTKPGVSVDRIIISSDPNCTPTNMGETCAVGDLTPPEVALTSPANDASVQGKVPITANATDLSGIAQVKFLIDGQAMDTAGTASPYSFSWNSTDVSNGIHTIEAQAVDNAGNAATSTKVKVTVRNTDQCTIDPSVPSGLTITNRAFNTITLTWAASAPGSSCTLRGYKVFRDGNLDRVVTDGTIYTDPGLTPDTSYEYTVAAIDTSGHSSDESPTVSATTVRDTARPSTPLYVHTSLMTAHSITLAWTASYDNVGIGGYQVFRDGARIGSSNTNAYTDYQVSPGKTHTYVIKAIDTSNNISPASLATHISIHIPETVSIARISRSAVVSAVPPGNPQPVPLTDGSTVQFNNPTILQSTPPNVAAVDKVEYYLSNKLVASATQSPYRYLIDTTKLRNGSYVLTAKTYYRNGIVNSIDFTLGVKSPFGITQFGLQLRHYTWAVSIAAVIIVEIVWAFVARRQGSNWFSK